MTTMYGVKCVVLPIIALFTVTNAGSAYQWRTDSWSLCRHTDCGPGGQQTRRVWCGTRDPGQAKAAVSPDSDVIAPSRAADVIYSDKKCQSMIRPLDTRGCFHVCDFHRHQYHWRIGEWSRCGARPDKRACQEDVGVRTRNVTCMAKCGGVAPSSDICETFDRSPPITELCQQDCPLNCIVSDFGAWTSCDTCWVRNATRFRSVVRAPSGGRFCPSLTESRRCPKKRECDEYRHTNFQYKLGNWTECLPFHGTERRGSRGFTSVLGHRRRTVDCVKAKGSLVDKTFCTHLDHPSSVQLCVLPRDCLVSHWSNWTSFSQSVPTPSSRIKLMRQRNVLQVPRGTGHVCPDLNQDLEVDVDEAEVNCNDYRWIRGNWGECVLTVDSDSCGIGVQTRPVLCVRNSDTVPVQDHYCAFEAPVHTRSCDVFCPQTCVMSDWSTWGTCLPDQCRHSRTRSKSGYRVRTRRILRDGAYGSAPCPHEKETQECDYPACYRWRLRQSGECILKYPDMTCGEGRQNRISECVNLNDETVSTRHCFDQKPVSHEVCDVPCAHDCVTSQWSAWSQCSQTCGIGRTTGYMTRKREILAQSVADGAPCPPPRMLEEKERCNEYPCDTYHWKTSAWSVCRMTDTIDRCGVGRQERDVTCYNNEGEKVTNKRCRVEEIPSTSQNCTVPCPKNCVSSTFTDWSACPVTCLKDDAKNLPEQYRWRFVLENPSADGVPCPEMREKRPCMNLPRCATYSWRLSEWSQCMYATHYDACGYGYRDREVRCLNDRDEVLPEEICISQLGSMSDVTQKCHVASCEQDTCKFSDWSEWTGCTKRCGGHRKRIRHMEGVTNRIMACYDRANYPLEQKSSCDCPPFTRLQVGNWSSCLLEDSTVVSHRRTYDPDGYYNNTRSPIALIGQLRPGQGHCGVGLRSQAIICQSLSLNVSAQICDSAEFAEEMCFIPCPRDCVMNEWTDWGRCVTSQRCGLGSQSRSRYLLESSLDGGRDCPDLRDGEEYEQRPCYVDCEQYGWVVEPWHPCTAVKSSADSTNCGVGFQSRIVRCMRTYDDAESNLDAVEVREYYCDPRTKPVEMDQCDVPCPADCVTSHWSEWSECTQDCNTNSTRHRTRSVERRPASGTGVKCPQLREVAYCQPGINCFVYEWLWSEWSPCQIDSQLTCGTGRRRRYAQCQRNDGQPMDKQFCRNIPISPSDLVSDENCVLPCPVDCTVSQWTEWSTCSRTCDIGYQTRSRNVLIHPANRGRQCPEALGQVRPCPFVECFHWAVSEWSSCSIEGGSCGYGTQSRNLSCVRHDGVSADISMCPREYRAHFKLEQSCLLPCPGDCVLSHWSVWGPCHRPCQAPYDADGQQSRSRVVISDSSGSGEPCPPPTSLWETRRCRGGTCPTYHWQTTPWFGERRSVWCQRADGMRVYGGCQATKKPLSVKACSPDCTIPQTFCSDVNKCSCHPGYRAVYDEGKLIWCTVMEVNSNQTSPEGEDVKNQPLLLPEDGPSNFWMYAVIAAGCAFVIFVIVAVYTIFKHTRKESSRRTSAATTLRSKRTSEPSINGTPLMPRADPMTKLEPQFYNISEDNT